MDVSKNELMKWIEFDIFYWIKGLDMSFKI